MQQQQRTGSSSRAAPNVGGGGVGWGSLLNKAVANLESSLDRVLENQPQAKGDAETPRDGAASDKRAAAAPSGSPGGGLPSAASSQRLQERLAAAMAAKNNSRTGSPVSHIVSPLEQQQPETMQQDEEKKSEESVRVEEATPPEEQRRHELEFVEARRVEEATEAASRISELESKVAMLVELAKEKSDTEGDDRDRKIALLLEEGEKLSMIEMKHLSTIKKLRAQKTVDDKAQVEAVKRTERIEKESIDLRIQLRKSQDIEKLQGERIRGYAQMEATLSALRLEKIQSESTLKVLREELMEAKTKIEVLTEASRTFSKQQDQANKLREELQMAESTAAINAQRAASDIKNLNSTMQQERSKTRVHIADLENEVQNLESKVELFRARAEEASVGESSHSQAKLLRQIELLQNQHAHALQNWEKIETTLIRKNDEVDGRYNEMKEMHARLRIQIEQSVGNSRNCM